MNFLLKKIITASAVNSTADGIKRFAVSPVFGLSGADGGSGTLLFLILSFAVFLYRHGITFFG